jgi:AbiJ N-terminal domain 4
VIYDIFSKRDLPLPDVYQYVDLPKRLRVQLVQLLDEMLSRQARSNEFGTIIFAGFAAIRRIVLREHGLHFLMNDVIDPRDDVLRYIDGGPNLAVILDLVEIACKMTIKMTKPGPNHVRVSENEANDFTEEINHRFLENGVGFQFDPTAKQLIRIDNQFAHKSAVQPALQLLADPRFKTANEEFLEGFDDYRKGDYDDCLTKCNTAFESVLKIICSIKGWKYNDKQTAGPLLKTHLDNNGLEPFFEQPLIIIATLRNQLSKSHGAGMIPKIVPEHYARYALNATASAIMLLIDAAQIP